jgi:hypothetical protein
VKLFLLAPIEATKTHRRIQLRWGYDCTYSVVVRAKDEGQARELAAGVAGGEGADAWRDPELTSCSPLKAAGPAEVVLQDFLAG